MSLTRKVLSLNSENYYFDVISKDKNTFSVQLSNSSSVLADFPLDPLDNTLAAVLSEDAMAILGKDAEMVLNALSQFLQEHIGAKEFILVPAGEVLPDYVAAQDASFKRLRHAGRCDLVASSSLILEQYPELAEELDKEFEVVLGIEEIAAKLQHDKPYEEISALLNNHANFTPGKMSEYKEEEIDGAKARFNNRNVMTMALLNKQHRLSGIIRSLSMGSEFSYLSDETINQELLPVEPFKGDSVADQAKNRATFLLAYLVNKACTQIKNQDHFLLIAAAGREDIYDTIGLQTFPMLSNPYVVMIKLGKPGVTLTSIKEQMLKPSFSNAAIMSGIGLMSVSAPAAVVSTEQKQFVNRK